MDIKPALFGVVVEQLLELILRGFGAEDLPIVFQGGSDGFGFLEGGKRFEGNGLSHLVFVDRDVGVGLLLSVLTLTGIDVLLRLILPLGNWFPLQ